MLKIQNDEIIIEKLYSHLISEFPRLRFEVKIPLKQLFSEPENKWLKSIWSYGHADIVAFRHGKLITVIEPGGFFHLKSNKQKLRDRKKDRLCELNNVNVLRLVNSIVDNGMCNKKFKKLLKKYFYGMARFGGVGLS